LAGAIGFLYGVPLVASNLALSALETDLIQLVFAGCTCLFFLRGVRDRSQGSDADPRSGQRQSKALSRCWGGIGRRRVRGSFPDRQRRRLERLAWSWSR